MANAVESANLILKLYELRREETMRKARNFVFGLDPRSADDYIAIHMGPDSAYLRMVASYWEMAASFVVNGAIDASMFEDSAGEHIIVFGKVEPFLGELRAKFDHPHMFANLEKVCQNMPGGIERVRSTTARIRGMLAASKAAAATN